MDILSYLLTPAFFWIVSIIWATVLVLNLRSYKKDSCYIKNFVNKCTECTATIIQPVVLNISNADTALSVALAVFSGFQIIRLKCTEYTTTEVLFNVNGEKIQTMILRRNSFRVPKFDDEIKIYYDPDNPKHAFAKDMKKIMISKPLKECIMSLVITIVFALSAVFIKYLDLSVIL